MQRSKPWRAKPTQTFVEKANYVQGVRFYVVAQKGPTSFVLENDAGRKFTVQIGSQVSCTCGGGKEEQCIHSIYVLLKIFRLDVSDPLLWQLAYVDSQISKIIQSRFAVAPRVRQSAAKVKEKSKAVTQSQPSVERKSFEEDPLCSICHMDFDQEEENITFCKHGCGHNYHVDCVQRWAKHKVENCQKITCPLCRCDWGPNALLQLQQQKKQFSKAAQKKKRIPDAPASYVTKSFKCCFCQSRVQDEPKYHCTICPKILLCQNCFSFGQHSQHHFVMNTGGDDPEWYPALRDGEQGVIEEEKKEEETDEVARARQILAEMQSRQITPQDYDTLKEVEEVLRRAAHNPPRQQAVGVQRPSSLPLAGFLTNAYQSYIEGNELGTDSQRMSMLLQRGLKSLACSECETHLTGSREDQFKCLKLKCGHFLHRTCLEGIFQRKDNKCSVCKRIILEGLQAARTTKQPAQINKNRTQRMMRERAQQEERAALLAAAGPNLAVTGTLFQINSRRNEGPHNRFLIHPSFNGSLRSNQPVHEPDLGMSVVASQMVISSPQSDGGSEVINPRTLYNGREPNQRPNVIVRQIRKAVRPKKPTQVPRDSNLGIDGSALEGRENHRTHRTQSTNHIPPQAPRKAPQVRQQTTNIQALNLGVPARGNQNVRTQSQGARVSNFNSHIARMNRMKKKEALQILGPAIIQPRQPVDPHFEHFVIQNVANY